MCVRVAFNLDVLVQYSTCIIYLLFFLCMKEAIEATPIFISYISDEYTLQSQNAIYSWKAKFMGLVRVMLPTTYNSS